MALVAQLEKACSQLTQAKDYEPLEILAILLSDAKQMNFVNLPVEDRCLFGRFAGWRETPPGTVRVPMRSNTQDKDKIFSVPAEYPGTPSEKDRLSFLRLVQAGRIHDVYEAIYNGYDVNAHGITMRNPEEEVGGDKVFTPLYLLRLHFLCFQAMTALYHATQRKDEGMVRLLFAAGAVKTLKLSAEVN